jgi:phosphohistidine phosphatase
MALDTLLLMRHAKSSWKFDDLSDHQRPLNGRGRRAAKAVGGALRARDLLPVIVWSSDSTRTRETVAKLIPDSHAADIEFLNGFYHSSANNILYMCTERGEPENGPLMLLGHNPGWEDLFFHFADISRRMPTGACAVFKRTGVNIDWLDGKAWRLQDLILPRDLEI